MTHQEIKALAGHKAVSPWIMKLVGDAIAIEREACAKVCENIYTGEEACGDWPTPEMCAEAIRARGKA